MKNKTKIEATRIKDGGHEVHICGTQAQLTDAILMIFVTLSDMFGRDEVFRMMKVALLEFIELDLKKLMKKSDKLVARGIDKENVVRIINKERNEEIK